MSSDGLTPEMCQLWDVYKSPDGRSKVIRSGYLMKRPTNKKFGGIKKRYFVLLYRALLYYADKVDNSKWNDEPPKGIIPLNEKVEIRINDKNELMLEVTHSEKHILLQAWGESIDETRQWKETINKLFQEVKGHLSIGLHGEFSAHLDGNIVKDTQKAAASIFGNDANDIQYDQEGQDGLQELDDEEALTYGEDFYDNSKVLYGGNTFVNGNTLVSQQSVEPTLQATMTMGMGNTFIVNDDNKLDALYG